MAKMIWGGGTLLGPVPPVLVSCATAEHSNLLTVAWTGIVNTKPPMTYVSIRPQRYSYEIIQQTREFAINLTTEDMARAVDLCGVKSGRNGDKWQLSHLTPEWIFPTSCPVVAQSPLSLLCKVKEIIPLGSHDMFLAEITAVCADEQYMDVHGKLHLERCGLLAYCHGEYMALGRRLGKFGFSVQKKKKRR